MSIPKTELAPISESTLETLKKESDRLFQKAIEAAPLRQRKIIGGYVIPGGLSTWAVTERAHLQLDFHDPNAARETLNLEMVDAPTEELIAAYIKLAQIEGKAGNKPNALSTLQKALSLVPHLTLDRDGYGREDCYEKISTAYAEQGEAEMAVQALNPLLAGDADNNLRRHNLFVIAVTLARHGEVDSAFTFLEKKGLTESKDGVWSNLAVDYAKKGGFQLWEETVARITSPTELIPYSYFEGAKYHLEHGNPEKAKQWLVLANQKIIALKNEDFSFGSDYEQGRYVDFALHELQDLKTAVEIAKTMAPGLFTVISLTQIAKTQSAQGDYDAALNTLKTAREMTAIAEEKTEEHNLRAKLAIVDTLLQFDYTEEAEQLLRETIIPEKEIVHIIDQFLAPRGYFILALRLSNRYQGRIKAARLGGIAHKMIKQGAGEQAIPVLQEEMDLITEHVKGKIGPEYIREARESVGFLGHMAENYQQLGMHQVAQQLIKELWEILYSTRDDENKYWYANTLRDFIGHAINTGNFDMALRATQEISLPRDFATIAESLIKAGQSNLALEQLEKAEELADDLDPKNPGAKSEAYLTISNAYYFSLQTLRSSMVVKGYSAT